MKAVILAAGEGKRMQPLTLSTPKPLLCVAGRPILERILDSLPSEVDELIFIIGYKGEMVRAHFGNEYKGRRIHYRTQEKPLGTAHAIGLARDMLTERFLVMFGDDLHGSAALRALLEKPSGILVARHEHPERFGVVSLRSDGTIEDIEEKPSNPKTNLVYAGPMVVNPDTFSYEAPLTSSGEHYFIHSFVAYAKEHPSYAIEQPAWISIGYPEDIAAAEKRLTEIE